MAIYRLEAKIMGRQAKDLGGKALQGQQVSVVAKAAYRSGERLHDERIDKTFDYRSRTQEVVHHSILAPKTAPTWLQGPESREKRERLWNAVAKAEKRKDSQLAREFIISLPKELDREAQVEAVQGWCEQELVSKGFVVDVAVHGSRDGKNPHAHVLCTLRPIEAEGFGLKPSTAGKFNGRGDVGRGAKGDLELWRESWAEAENRALERAGSEARVDHHSLAAQGIDRLPEPKMGVAAVHMQREGKLRDPDRVRETRRVRVYNAVLPNIREIERSGEVKQDGLGMDWRERAAPVFGRVYDRAVEFLKDESSGGTAWRDYVEQRRKRDIEPDLPR